jgi:hypothetical protein
MTSKQDNMENKMLTFRYYITTSSEHLIKPNKIEIKSRNRKLITCVHGVIMHDRNIARIRENRVNCLPPPLKQKIIINNF